MFPKGLRIYAGHAMREDLICVALTRPDIGRPFSIILVYEHGLPQPWTRIDVKRTIVSISDGKLEASRERCFIALSDEGDVYFLEAEQPVREKVPGMGIHSSDANGRGAATRVQGEGGESLVVLGQRGQVFRRLNPEQWLELPLGSPPVEVPGDIVNPTAIVSSGSATMLAGFIYPVQRANPEALAARKSGDRRLYAQLKVRGARLQHGCLYKVAEGRWQRIALPTSVKLYDMILSPNGTPLIAGGHGTVLMVEGEEEITVLGGEETSEEIVSLCQTGDEILAASEAGLFRIAGDTLEAISGPEGSIASMLRLIATGNALWAIGTERISKREYGRWYDIAIPPNMLEVPFRG